MKISAKLTTILQYAREEAMRTGSYAICIDHLTLGIIRDAENDAARALLASDIRLDDLKQHIEAEILCERSVPFEQADKLGVSRGAQSAINMAGMEMLKESAAEMEPRHLLLAISKTNGNATRAFFERTGISSESLGKLFAAENKDQSPARTEQKKPHVFTQYIHISTGEHKIFS